MSGDRLFSGHWHRVRDVRPRLADDVMSIRHVYRGRPSWVLQRRATSGVHRLDSAAFELVDQLDGQRTVGEVWEQALIERDSSAPTQDEWIALLAALQAAELLNVDRRVSPERLFERRDERRSRERRERRLNPLYLRFGLHDPDAWLTRLTPLSHALFSRTALVVWLALMVAGVLAILIGGESLVSAVTTQGFPSPRTALFMLLLYFPLKFLHELGHALAVKRGGGEVHEIGIALMVLVPLPYVDASASAAFPDKRDRMLVAAAGILVELMFAAIGALLFSGSSGVIAEIGLALLLVGGASTLLINGNPLLRFDGYYLLADALEIPNLVSRSRRAVLERLRAWLSGEPERGVSVSDVAERRWLLAYGVASALYRTGLMLWIAWWLSGRFPVFGGALALYALVTAMVLPLWRGLGVVASDPSLHAMRPRLLVSGIPLTIAALVMWLPLPHSNMTSGVVWLPDEAIIRAQGACEITATSVRPGDKVLEGQALFDCFDPELSLRERELIARGDELEARLAGFARGGPSEHSQLKSERRANDSALADTRERMAGGTRVAAVEGLFDIPGTAALLGRALERGAIAGYVVPSVQRTVRVALEESVAGRLDTGLSRVELRIRTGTNGLEIHRSSIIARTPRAGREVISAALSSVGGGEHRADPSGNGMQVLEPVFDIEIAWPDDAGPAPVGAHVDVRFVHEPTPLGGRLVDTLRRAFSERSHT